jgi:hypothetical protein
MSDVDEPNWVTERRLAREADERLRQHDLRAEVEPSRLHGRVHALEAIQTAEGERPPVLPWDLSLVENMIAERASQDFVRNLIHWMTSLVDL